MSSGCHILCAAPPAQQTRQPPAAINRAAWRAQTGALRPRRINAVCARSQSRDIGIFQFEVGRDKRDLKAGFGFEKQGWRGIKAFNQHTHNRSPCPGVSEGVPATSPLDNAIEAAPLHALFSADAAANKRACSRVGIAIARNLESR